HEDRRRVLFPSALRVDTNAGDRPKDLAKCTVAVELQTASGHRVLVKAANPPGGKLHRVAGGDGRLQPGPVDVHEPNLQRVDLTAVERRREVTERLVAIHLDAANDIADDRVDVEIGAKNVPD